MQHKTFRLFISSTFSDFEKEREVLHKKVFPQIEKHCIDNGFTFQPVDLRWGVSNEAQLDQKTLKLCLEEVRACKHFPHPNFLIMVGNRYGYIPLPYMIEKIEFEKIKDYITEHNNTITIEYHPERNLQTDAIISQKGTRITTKLELLKEWYKIDENQIYIDGNNKESTAYILQQRDKDYKIYVNWQAEEDILRKILQEAAESIFNSEMGISEKEYQKYFLSATEQEVIEGICAFKDKTTAQKDCDKEIDKKYILGYLRDIDNANGKYIDDSVTLQKKVRKFKDNLQVTLNRETNIMTYRFISTKDYIADELKVFEEFIVKKLIDSIDDQVKEFKAISKLEQEILVQGKFLQDKVKNFRGREMTLMAIENYINVMEVNQPLIIHGLSGIGKSSLLAKAIENTKSDSKIFRFVGATADSSNSRTLLISIVDELQANNLIDKIEEYEFDNDKFDIQIKDIFSSIQKEVILFIDALDQLQQINHLNWLPNVLQPNLKIIFSVLNDKKYKEDSHYYNLLYQKYNNSSVFFIDITKDSLEKNKEELIINLLKVEHRKLDEYQTNYLLEKWKKTDYSPLYLKIAMEEIKHWKSGDKSQELNDSIEGIILEYIENLTSYYHHEELLIKKVFGYIYASKDGISEQELLQILSEDLEDESDFRDVIINKYHKAIKVKNPRRTNKEEYILPISVWSRLHTQIRPFIIERNIDNLPLMKFFHRQFNSVVENFVNASKLELHDKLYHYFYTSSDKRKAVELLYHAYILNDTKKFFHLFFNEKNLLVNINKGLLYEVLDYVKSLTQIKNIKKYYLKYKPLNIEEEEYYENLRFIAYLLGSLDFEKEVLDNWEIFDSKSLINSFNLYKYLSDISFRMGDVKQAISYSNLAKKYVITESDKIDLNLSLIRLYTFTGDMENASNLISQIQNSNVKNKLSLRKKAEYYQELSFPFHDADNNKQFSAFNKKAKKIYKELNSRYDYCIAGVNEGDGYWGSGMLEKAITSLKESLDKSLEWELDHAINISYICLANIYSSINNREKNLKLYTTGIELSIKIGHNWDEIYSKIYYNLAKAETHNINTSEELLNLSKIALKKGYHYLYELARSYSLVVSMFFVDYTQSVNINDFTINSAKIYHLAYDLLVNKNKKNIDEIFRLLSIVDGIKGRPYVIYYILEIHSFLLNEQQKDLLNSFAYKCYLDSELAKIYKTRLHNNV